MKKIFIFAPIAALAMASCSSDSVVEQNPSKVAEANALQIFPDIQGTTRGTVWDNGNFAEFHLKTSGSFIMVEDADAAKAAIESGSPAPATIDKNVAKAGGAWKIDATGTNLYFWPSKSSESKFTAWAPKEASAGAYEAVGGKNSEDLSKTVDLTGEKVSDVSGQKDIVVAFNEGKASDFETGVPLKFRHMTSQIVIKADNADKSSVQINVKAIRLNNIKTTGKWSLPTASTVDGFGGAAWTGQGDEKNYIIEQASTVTLSDGTAADLTGSNPLLLIPQTLEKADIAAGTKQYFSVLIQVKDGVGFTNKVYPNAEAVTAHSDLDYAWVAVDVNGTWEPGKKYIYTLHFAKDSYGKMDYNQKDGGNPEPMKGGSVTPGEDVVDTPVQLILDVEVMDWEEVPNSQNM